MPRRRGHGGRACRARSAVQGAAHAKASPVGVQQVYQLNEKLLKQEDASPAPAVANTRVEVQGCGGRGMGFAPAAASSPPTRPGQQAGVQRAGQRRAPKKSATTVATTVGSSRGQKASTGRQGGGASAWRRMPAVSPCREGRLAAPAGPLCKFVRISLQLHGSRGGVCRRLARPHSGGGAQTQGGRTRHATCPYWTGGGGTILALGPLGQTRLNPGEHLAEPAAEAGVALQPVVEVSVGHSVVALRTQGGGDHETACEIGLGGWCLCVGKGARRGASEGADVGARATGMAISGQRVLHTATTARAACAQPISQAAGVRVDHSRRVRPEPTALRTLRPRSASTHQWPAASRGSIAGSRRWGPPAAAAAAPSRSRAAAQRTRVSPLRATCVPWRRGQAHGR